MSIKVLIVDDEKLERVLIHKGYKWEDNGFEVVGEAASGMEALEMVKEHKPQIVLTDICMPSMDGLELSEKILQINPGTFIVIITGYREFDYARRAIKIGVEDFLLKPVNISELGNITKKLKEKITFKAYQKSMNKIVDIRETERVKQGNRVVNEALKYVDSNIFDPELTLKMVASKVFSNESYLSRAFKKEIGVTFVEYISKKRIEESVRLLNTTDMKVYEIAEKIGFRDSHYFSLCFKKHIGITIKEYKKDK